MERKIFIDSDILFQFFAINKVKEQNFFNLGTTGDNDLDQIMKLIQEIEKNDQAIYLSEFSILEILCTLNRLNSSYKCPIILTKIYRICEILPLEDLMIKLSWFIGSNYDLHSGDALHIAFCLSNDIEKIILKDKKFYQTCFQIKNDFNSIGFQKINDFFSNIQFAQGIPKRIRMMYSNIKNLSITRI